MVRRIKTFNEVDFLKPEYRGWACRVLVHRRLPIELRHHFNIRLKKHFKQYIVTTTGEVFVDDLKGAINSCHKWVVHCKREEFDVLIDRTTEWGNPYVIGKDGDREAVIRKYREYVASPSKQRRIKEKLRGKILGCWCSPKPCHGDVLAEIANQ